jgi:hypothetical protein
MRKRSSGPTATAVVGAILLAGLCVAAAADATVTELQLEDGGMQRILYASPANPRAALIMLPGGNGMVEFGPDGAIRRMAESFLLRTLPLWQAQGFAVAVLTPPNGMSLFGYRHTPAYAAALGQAKRRSGASALAKGGAPPTIGRGEPDPGVEAASTPPR